MSKNCHTIHQWFNSMPKLVFPFDEKVIPLNGVYILFEKGELGHGTNRIVRIGTHTGINQLISRLHQHFINEVKDRSIFRKNIGRCLLNKTNDNFIEQWELDLTTRKAKEKYSNLVDFKKQAEIEKKVSRYIQEHFSFTVFPIKDKASRIRLESRIISTVSWCDECKSSDNWLGLYCPNKELQSNRTYKNCLKLSKSGLWLVNELYKQPLSDEEVKELRIILGI